MDQDDYELFDPRPTGATAVPTEYEGVVFRSRLEARWAVFFEVLALRALYEQEAYELADGTRYLPDFWLPALSTFVEIKPAKPSADEVRKCRLLAAGTGRQVLLLSGAPGDWLNYAWTSPRRPHDFGIRFYPLEGEDGTHLLCECPKCGVLDWQYEGRAARLACPCDKSALRGKEGRDESPRIARAAKFANAVNLGVR